MNAPEAPFFVSPHRDESEGVDYLGLRATNLSMMATLLPGINNIVMMVRPFSVMAWIAWKYEQTVLATKTTASPSGFRRFQEKVETLFVWSHVQGGSAASLPGNQQVDVGTPVLDFQFKPFSRTASLLDAALYGPAMKTLNGLGFLFSAEGFFKPTDAGGALAKGLDASLLANLTTAQYDFVSSLTATTAPRVGLAGIQPGWDADNASAAECAAFAQRLYQPQEIGKAHIHANRSTVLYLVLEHLRAASAPMQVDAMRERLAALPLPAAAADHPAVDVFRNARRYWQVLQVRQAQRLGLESLFGWVERCLIEDNATSVSELVDLTLKAMERDGGGMAFDDGYIGSRLAFYAHEGASVDALFAAGLTDASLNIFKSMEGLEAVTSNTTTATPMALKATELLVQCTAYAEAFKHDPFAAQHINDGPKFRVPLGYWAEAVRHHQSLPLRTFLRKVIETFLISQHLGIAASRAGDERSRMRISIEDRGLTSLLPGQAKVFKPGRTPDRLGAAMALMHSCGLIQANTPARHSATGGPLYRP